MKRKAMPYITSNTKLQEMMEGLRIATLKKPESEKLNDRFKNKIKKEAKPPGPKVEKVKDLFSRDILFMKRLQDEGAVIFLKQEDDELLKLFDTGNTGKTGNLAHSELIDAMDQDLLSANRKINTSDVLNDRNPKYHMIREQDLTREDPFDPYSNLTQQERIRQYALIAALTNAVPTVKKRRSKSTLLDSKPTKNVKQYIDSQPLSN